MTIWKNTLAVFLVGGLTLLFFETRFQKFECRFVCQTRIGVGGLFGRHWEWNTRRVYFTIFKKNFLTKNLQVIHK